MRSLCNCLPKEECKKILDAWDAAVFDLRMAAREDRGKMVENETINAPDPLIVSCLYPIARVEPEENVYLCGRAIDDNGAVFEEAKKLGCPVRTI